MSDRIKEYAKNLGKSFKYLTMDLAEDFIPGSRDMMEKMTTTVKNLRSSDNISTARASMLSLKRSPIVKETTKIVTDTLNNLKTGKVYNSIFAQFDSMMSNFDDFQFDDYDFGNDDIELTEEERMQHDLLVEEAKKTKANPNSELTLGDRLAARATIDSATAIATALGTKLDSMMVESKADMAKLTTTVQNSLAETNTYLKSISEFNGTVMKEFVEKSAKYYQTNNELLQEVKNILYRTFPAPTHGPGASTRNGQQNWLEQLQGGDFRGFAKSIGSKALSAVDSRYMGGSLGMASMMPSLFKMMGPNIVGEIVRTMMIVPLIERKLGIRSGSSSTGFMEIFTQKLQTMFAKMSVSGKNGLLKEFATAMNIKQTQNIRPDTEKYEKGVRQFDGITREAIVTVIPSYLSKILAAITDQKEFIYNYEKRRFMTHEQIATEFYEGRPDYKHLNKNFARYVSNKTIESGAARDVSEDRIQKFVNKAVKGMSEKGYDLGLLGELNYEKMLTAFGVDKNDISKKEYLILANVLRGLRNDKEYRNFSRDYAKVPASMAKYYRENLGADVADKTGMLHLINASTDISSYGAFGGRGRAKARRGNRAERLETYIAHMDDLRNRTKSEDPDYIPTNATEYNNMRRTFTSNLSDKEFEYLEKSQQDQNIYTSFGQYLLDSGLVDKMIKVKGFFKGDVSKLERLKKLNPNNIKNIVDSKGEITNQFNEAVKEIAGLPAITNLFNKHKNKFSVDREVVDEGVSKLMEDISGENVSGKDKAKAVGRFVIGAASKTEAGQSVKNKIEKGKEWAKEQGTGKLLLGGAASILGLGALNKLVRSLGGVGLLSATMGLATPVFIATAGLGAGLLAKKYIFEKKVLGEEDGNKQQQNSKWKEILKNGMWGGIATSAGIAGVKLLGGLTGTSGLMSMMYNSLGMLGPIGLASTAIGLGMMANSKKINEKFFGKDKKDKSFHQNMMDFLFGEKGIFGKVKGWFKQKKENAVKWFSDMIATPFKEMMKPMKTMMKDAWSTMKQSFLNIPIKIGESTMSIAEAFNKKVAEPLGKFVNNMTNRIGNFLGKIFSAPIRWLTNLFKSKVDKARERNNGQTVSEWEARGVGKDDIQAQNEYHAVWDALDPNKKKGQDKQSWVASDGVSFDNEDDYKYYQSALDNPTGKGRTPFYSQNGILGSFSSFMSSEGCGIASAAMALSGVLNERITPEDIMEIALQFRGRKGGIGLDFFNSIATKFNIPSSCYEKGDINVRTVDKLLKDGSKIIALITLSDLNKHYIVIDGIVSDAYMVYDPAKKSPTKFSKHSIIAQSTHLVVFGKVKEGLISSVVDKIKQKAKAFKLGQSTEDKFDNEDKKNGSKGGIFGNVLNRGVKGNSSSGNVSIGKESFKPLVKELKGVTKAIKDSKKDIVFEISQSLNGVAYNMEYIKRIMVSHFGDIASPPDAQSIFSMKFKKFKNQGLQLFSKVKKGIGKTVGKTMGIGKWLFGKSFDTMMLPFKMAGKVINKGVKVVTGTFKALGKAVDMVGKAARAVFDIPRFLVKSMFKVTSVITDGIKGVFNTGFHMLKETFSTVNAVAKGILKSLIDGSFFTKLFSGISSFGKGLMKGIGSTIAGIGRGIGSTIAGIGLAFRGGGSFANNIFSLLAGREIREVRIKGGTLDKVAAVDVVGAVGAVDIDFFRANYEALLRTNKALKKFGVKNVLSRNSAMMDDIQENGQPVDRKIVDKLQEIVDNTKGDDKKTKKKEEKKGLLDWLKSFGPMLLGILGSGAGLAVIGKLFKDFISNTDASDKMRSNVKRFLGSEAADTATANTRGDYLMSLTTTGAHFMDKFTGKLSKFGEKTGLTKALGKIGASAKNIGKKGLNYLSETKGGKFVVEKGGTIIKAAKSLLTKIGNIIMSVTTRFAPNKVKSLGKFVDWLTGHAGKFGMKLAERVGTQGAKAVFRNALSLLNIALAVTDAWQGWNDAPLYFGIKDEDCTIGMKLTSALTSATIGLLNIVPVIGVIAAIVLPTDVISKFLYKCVADEEAEKELANKRSKVDTELNKVNADRAAKGQSALTREEYLKQNHRTFGQAVWGATKNYFNYATPVGLMYNGYKLFKENGFRGGIQKLKDGTAELVKKAVDALPDGLVKKFVEYKDKLFDFGSKIKEAFKDLQDTFNKKMDDMLSALKDIPGKLYDAVTGKAGELWDNAKEGVSNWASRVKNSIKDKLSGNGDFVSQKSSKYKNLDLSLGGEGATFDKAGCGPATLMMALSDSGKGYNAQQLTRIARGYRNGISSGVPVSYLTDVLNANGVNARFRKLGGGIRKASGLTGRNILLTKTASGTPHYIYTKGIDRNGNVIVNDPMSSGTKRLSLNSNLIRNAEYGVKVGGFGPGPEVTKGATNGSIGYMSFIKQIFNRTLGKMGASDSVFTTIERDYGGTSNESGYSGPIPPKPEFGSPDYSGFARPKGYKIPENNEDELFKVAIEQLKIDEGWGAKVYKDSEGLDTIGYGFCIDKNRKGPFTDEQIKRWRANGITVEEAEQVLWEKFIGFYRGAQERYPWFNKLDATRRMAIANILYNMGFGNKKRGFNSFVNTQKALAAGDFNKAAEGFRDSNYYKQTGNRAKRIIKLIQDGAFGPGLGNLFGNLGRNIMGNIRGSIGGAFNNIVGNVRSTIGGLMAMPGQLLNRGLNYGMGLINNFAQMPMNYINGLMYQGTNWLNGLLGGITGRINQFAQMPYNFINGLAYQGTNSLNNLIGGINSRANGLINNTTNSILGRIRGGFGDFNLAESLRRAGVRQATLSNSFNTANMARDLTRRINSDIAGYNRLAKMANSQKVAMAGNTYNSTVYNSTAPNNMPDVAGAIGGMNGNIGDKLDTLINCVNQLAQVLIKTSGSNISVNNQNITSSPAQTRADEFREKIHNVTRR